jgi:ABC-type Fe3+/spermidine/putrescine transport system ATPase subunit
MIEIKNLSLRLGEFHLRHVDLKVEQGSYFVILGPTGAGKTVLVECIAGVEKPDEGEIWIDGVNITDFLPEDRNIGYMPQDYTLFPNMTVESNISFGLRIKKVPRDAINERVRELAGLLDISHLMHRYPLKLSGGEKQRVSLARALATKPTALLLDEPLSALDESMRASFCKDLRRIQQSTGATFVHVSHSFEETIDCADGIAILNEGRVVQVGSVSDILRRPKNEFMATFVRSENVFRGPAQSADGLTKVSVGGVNLFAAGLQSGNEAFLTIRPEDILLSRRKPESDHINVFEGKIKEITDRITFIRFDVDIGVPLVVFQTRSAWSVSDLAVGEKVYVSFDPDDANVF